MGICYITSKQSDAIIFFSLISSLYIVKKEDTKETCPSMDSPIHGEHNGASFNSVYHGICK